MPSGTLLFELDQRRRTLAALAWTTLVTSVALGVYDIQFHTWLSIFSLLAVGASCVPILILIHRRDLRLASILLSLVVLLAIALNLFDGDGVRDSGVLALPIFIIVGTLMFGKRAAPYFALASIAAVGGALLLEINGYIHPTLGPITPGFLVPVILLLGTAAVTTWIIVDVVEKNMLRAKESEAEVEQSYDRTLGAWARILEQRDRETQGHTERVTEMSERLARLMGVTGQSLVAIRRGAMLHDIGKLAIPDSILLKPGELTDSEWAVVKEHPSRARDVLAPIQYLRDAIDIPWAHHERWDGSGYPRGLRGEEIPVPARIFAVVDIWDALVSDRPYRAAMGTTEALEEIRAMAGTKLDPAVVAAFVAMQTSQPGHIH
ncbi:MAG TPA: HD-GYP domain-containing protein [Anaerolineales bacterium]|nr:HD-GYP domain-containing protein [Anaerolineales bacterium]